MAESFLSAPGLSVDTRRRASFLRKIGDKTYKVHLDGFNLMPFLKGDVKESPRPGFLYWSDEGELMAIRMRDWKIVFEEQRAVSLKVWREPLAGWQTAFSFSHRRRSR
jgi:arylsulfatase A-like enzyme